jgi:hypothetical protein
MRTIYVVIAVLFSFQCFAGDVDKSQAQSKPKRPSFALKKMEKLKTQKNVLKIFEEHMSPQNYSEFKKIGDELKMEYKKPFHLKITGKNRVQFGPQKEQFIFSYNGNHLRYSKAIFQLDKRKSVYWNYSNIVSKLKSNSSFGQKLALLPEAHAEGSESPSSAAYDVITLLYYMQIYKEDS